MIQDLSSFDNAKVNDALNALKLDFMMDENKRESFVTAGGCLALVHLLRNCLVKAIAELNELAELPTLMKTLCIITFLIFQHEGSQVGIVAIGSVKEVVEVMKTFPKCPALQAGACFALLHLICSNIGVAKAIESGGIKVLLAAINNHLGSAIACEKACWVLYNIVHSSNIVHDSKE